MCIVLRFDVIILGDLADFPIQFFDDDSSVNGPTVVDVLISFFFSCLPEQMVPSLRKE